MDVVGKGLCCFVGQEGEFGFPPLILPFYVMARGMSLLGAATAATAAVAGFGCGTYARGCLVLLECPLLWGFVVLYLHL